MKNIVKKISLLFLISFLGLSTISVDAMMWANNIKAKMNSSMGSEFWEFSSFVKSDLTDDEKETLHWIMEDRKSLKAKIMDIYKDAEDKYEAIETIKSKREWCMNRFLPYISEDKEEDFKKHCSDMWEKLIERLKNGWVMKNMNAEYKESRDLYKKEYKEIRWERDEYISENREEMKKNIQYYRENNDYWDILSKLDDETKEKFKELKNIFLSEIKALNDEYKIKERSEENIDAFIEARKALQDSHNSELKDLLSDNEEALEILEKKKEVYNKNSNLIKENMNIRKNFREKNKSLISKYRTSFKPRIESKLDNLSDEKLEKVLGKIETMIEKTDSKKENLLSALEALREIINEKLWVDDEYMDEDDLLEEIFE